jgi:hypothetical protein
MHGASRPTRGGKSNWKACITYNGTADKICVEDKIQRTWTHASPCRARACAASRPLIACQCKEAHDGTSGPQTVAVTLAPAPFLFNTRYAKVLDCSRACSSPVLVCACQRSACGRHHGSCPADVWVCWQGQGQLSSMVACCCRHSQL